VTIALIFSVTWLVVAFAKAIESTVVKGVQASENQGRANRVTTQSQIIRRVAQVVIVIAGLVSAIMTFPSVQLAMGSLLASAGLASVIAGMAARSMLGNVFAGLQLATTDAIRVDDVVVVDNEQGTIEEITLTYVVMRTWDERRLILPSTHFTENPFANWTRGGSQSTGTFTLELLHEAEPLVLSVPERIPKAGRDGDVMVAEKDFAVALRQRIDAAIIHHVSDALPSGRRATASVRRRADGSLYSVTDPPLGEDGALDADDVDALLALERRVRDGVGLTTS